MNQMARYQVKAMQDTRGTEPLHLVLSVSAQTAKDAISVALRKWTAEGWPGPFRYPVAENEADPHDTWQWNW